MPCVQLAHIVGWWRLALRLLILNELVLTVCMLSCHPASAAAHVGVAVTTYRAGSHCSKALSHLQGLPAGRPVLVRSALYYGHFHG